MGSAELKENGKRVKHCFPRKEVYHRWIHDDTYVYSNQTVSKNASATNGLLYFKEESKIDDTLEILQKENIELTTENQRLKTEIQTLNEQIKDLSSYTFTYKVPKTSYYKIKLYEKETLTIKDS